MVIQFAIGDYALVSSLPSEFDSRPRACWKYINPQRLSSDVVDRLEQFGRAASLAQNAHFMPNSTDASKKLAEIESRNSRYPHVITSETRHTRP
jgi:hypothetical protein